MRKLRFGGEMPSMPTDTPRCASYVRTAVVTSERSGLAALDAQRDMCVASIRNQLGGSWIASFEDLGFSGIGLKRPALRRLLAEVDAGGIDAVVVCHVDRLSRSAGARAMLLARFRDAGVSLIVAESTETPDAVAPDAAPAGGTRS